MHGRSQKSLADDMASPPYSKEVLIGNWAERRYAVEEQSNAILPGLRELPRLRIVQANMESDKSGPPKRPTEVDRLQAFGNLTRTHNYPMRFKCDKLLGEISNMQTTYSACFNRPWKSKPIFEYGPDYDGVVKFDLAC
ncbi:uncharacterized protein LOC128260231 isoform X2 [Drosophila gunungcola]|uniref:uncharacterized protein LOC128260231 isoform X2 n=1 Tax=Drosophila gunungcola TaxID=103775 RepID=UPI0022DFD433|nr:uncharacterized protein LOC128260231 isoform X2 [Drosophila gunungcola]